MISGKGKRCDTETLSIDRVLNKEHLYQIRIRCFERRLLKSFIKKLTLFSYRTYVTRMYLYVIRMSLVYTLMSSVCLSYVLVCHPCVTCMYSYVIRVSLVCVVLPWTSLNIVNSFNSKWINLPWRFSFNYKMIHIGSSRIRWYPHKMFIWCNNIFWMILMFSFVKIIKWV